MDDYCMTNYSATHFRMVCYSVLRSELTFELTVSSFKTFGTFALITKSPVDVDACTTILARTTCCNICQGKINYTQVFNK